MYQEMATEEKLAVIVWTLFVVAVVANTIAVAVRIRGRDPQAWKALRASSVAAFPGVGLVAEFNVQMLVAGVLRRVPAIPIGFAVLQVPWILVGPFFRWASFGDVPYRSMPLRMNLTRLGHLAIWGVSSWLAFEGILGV